MESSSIGKEMSHATDPGGSPMSAGRCPTRWWCTTVGGRLEEADTELVSSSFWNRRCCSSGIVVAVVGRKRDVSRDPGSWPMSASRSTTRWWCTTVGRGSEGAEKRRERMSTEGGRGEGWCHHCYRRSVDASVCGLCAPDLKSGFVVARVCVAPVPLRSQIYTGHRGDRIPIASKVGGMGGDRFRQRPFS